MDFRLIAVCLIVFVALFESGKAHHHHHGNSRNNNNNRRPRTDGLFSWTRDLGRRRQCRENAFVPPGSQLVFSQSVDEILPSANFQPANSLYDFSTPVPIGVIAPVNGSCFYTNATTLDLGQTIDTLNSINNTQITTTQEIPLDGTAEPLTPTQAQDLLAAHPAVVPVCHGREIIPTYPQGAAPIPFTGPVDLLRVFTLDSAARITVRRQRNNSREHHRGHDGDSRERGRNNRHW